MTKENLVDLKQEDFEKKIEKGKWVVDFWAGWCGPCRMMEPHFEAAAKEMNGKVNFAKVDVEGYPELAEKFQIFSIPTTLFFKDGKQVNRTSGAMGKDQILELTKKSF